jgi:hypothetical protein
MILKRTTSIILPPRLRAHPYHCCPELKEKYTGAFHAFSDLELVLCNEKEMPTTPTSPMPRSYEEMMRMRAEVQARRRKSSNGVNTAVARNRPRS